MNGNYCIYCGADEEEYHELDCPANQEDGGICNKCKIDKLNVELSDLRRENEILAKAVEIASAVFAAEHNKSSDDVKAKLLEQALRKAGE